MKDRQICSICGKKKVHSFRLSRLGVVLCPDCAWDSLKEIGKLSGGIRGSKK